MIETHYERLAAIKNKYHRRTPLIERNSGKPKALKTNYLLIDFENVQPKSLARLKNTAFKVLVFIGSRQTKVPVEFAKELQKLGDEAQYIQITGNGTNALDFHIAYTLGELSKTDPNAYFHVISKDTGFDPLVQYAKKKGIFVQRSKDIDEIPILLSNAKTRPEKIAAIVENLASRGHSRPRKIKTLSSTINALFQKTLSGTELSELIASLEKAGHIAIVGESITYDLQSAPQHCNEIDA